MFVPKNIWWRCVVVSICLLSLNSSVLAADGEKSTDHDKNESIYIAALDSKTSGHLLIGSRVTADAGVGAIPPMITLSLDCSNDVYDNPNFKLASNGIHIVSSIPAGTSCTVSQKKPESHDGYIYDEPIINPQQPVAIEAEKMKSIYVINHMTVPVSK